MRKFIFFVCTLVIAVVFYMAFDWYLRAVFSTIAMEESSKELSNCLDYGISSAITEDMSYDDLITIKQDEAGNVVLVQSNTIEMNRIGGNAAKKAEEMLLEKNKSGIQVPFGYLVGGQLFAEKMPCVTIHFRKIGNVTSSFSSTFTDAGINQTMHTVNLTLSIDALLLVPNNNVQFNTSITVPVCETIIIGNVPTEYREYVETYTDDEYENDEQDR